MELKEAYQTYKPLLFSIAYRMIGSIADSEDIVHDILLVLYEKEELENEVLHKKAFLCKMVTNRCIDYLNSARMKKEKYVGSWLPEPLVYLEENNHPLSNLLREDKISYALLTLLEILTPIERAIFILREAYDYSYSEIGDIVGKSDSNCRKILSRARQKLHLRTTEEQAKTSTENSERLDTHQELVKSFVKASETGDVEGVIQLLAKEITLYSDGGGKVLAALAPIQSSHRVLQFLVGIKAQFDKSGADLELKLVNVNGQTGLLIVANGLVESIMCFDIRDQQIQQIFIIRNPDKLRNISLL